MSDTVVIDGDRLNVTVERQVANFGDHTTVRAHLSVAVPPAKPDEALVDYQNRISLTVANLAYPLKEAVLVELGLPYTIDDDGIIHEEVQTEKRESVPATVPFTPAPAPAESWTQSSTPKTYPNIKVMDKGAGPDGKYGKVDPNTLSYRGDVAQAMNAAAAAGEDTLWTGVTNNRRWFRFAGNLWNKPEAPAAPSGPEADEPF